MRALRDLLPVLNKQAAVLPQAPDDHSVRRAIRLDRGDPVVVRLSSSAARPRPGSRPLLPSGKPYPGMCGRLVLGFFGIDAASSFFDSALTDLRLKIASNVQAVTEVLLRPLVDAFEGLLQVLQRIGNAEAQVAFAEFAEGGAGKRGHSSLLQQRIGQLLRFPSRLA